MRIKVPDDFETFTGTIDETESEQPNKEICKSFQQEIKEILKGQVEPSKSLVDKTENDSPKSKLQMLLKFTQLCREEIIPRHLKAIQTIQSKSAEQQTQMICQRNELTQLNTNTNELREAIERLETTKRIVQTRHYDLEQRLKEALQKLQDSCKNRTTAERKMAQDLLEYKKKSEDLNVAITETSSKMNYYKTQVTAQKNLVQKQVKPLYLDKKKVAFIRTNLNSTRKNIEELVQRVKNLKSQLSQGPETELDISQNVSQP